MLEQVQQTYEVPKGPQDTWPRCCYCVQRTRHRKGYVVLFSDQVPGLLGHDCGEIAHQLDYRTMLEQFNEHADRAGLLRRALHTFECDLGLRRVFGEMRTSQSITRLQAFDRALRQRLPAFHKKLTEAREGKIFGKRRVTDHDAMGRRDVRLEITLASVARRRGLDRTQPGVDRALLTELQASGDIDASKEKITTVVDMMLHQFVGSDLFSVIPNVGIRIQRIEQQLDAVLRKLRESPSESHSAESLRRLHVLFQAEMTKASVLFDEIDRAHGFVEQSNIANILRIWNQLHVSRPEHRIHQRGQQLQSDRPKADNVDIPELVAFDVSRSTLERLKRDYDAAYEATANDD